MRRIIAVVAVVAGAAAWTIGRPTPAASEDDILPNPDISHLTFARLHR